MSGVHRHRLTPRTAERLRRHDRLRTGIQMATAALTNGYAKGFAEGHIYGGRAKAVCVPWLNCYSCPGALGSCPVGSFQAVVGGPNRRLSFYVLGLLVLAGTMVGRLVCGLFCPFGLVQDLLHRIPVPKVQLPRAVDRPLRLLKYLVAAVLVVALPILAKGAGGMAPPYFCKYLCPAGTLEGALPLLAANQQLRSLAGAIFSWKLEVLVVVVVASTLIHRPFCRYLCPLGAFYALFNGVSLYQMHVDEGACVSCHACARVCPMGLDPELEVDGPECIRCGACKAACPASAIGAGFELRAREALKASGIKPR